MKTFEYVEKRIYIAQIEYNNVKHTSIDVFKAYKERFPEEGLKYEYEVINGCLSVCRIYRESCFDLIEKN